MTLNRLEKFFNFSFTLERSHAFQNAQSTPKPPSVKHETSKFNIDFKNLTKYKPRKHKNRHIVPAEKRIPLVKWRQVGNEFLSEIGGGYSPELNMTSERIANVAYENLTLPDRRVRRGY